MHGAQRDRVARAGARVGDRGHRRAVAARTCASRFPACRRTSSSTDRSRGSKLAGTVRQGALRGTFALRRGVSRIVQLLGVYRSAAGGGVAVTEADGLPPTLIEFPSGAIHGIGASLTVGERLGDKSGNGAIVTDATGFTWNGTHYTRLRPPAA